MTLFKKAQTIAKRPKNTIRKSKKVTIACSLVVFLPDISPIRPIVTVASVSASPIPTDTAYRLLILHTVARTSLTET